MLLYMKYAEIKDVVASQKELVARNIGMSRAIIDSVELPIEGFATIISGIRRCGKSTLMGQVIARTQAPCLYLNFDTPRLVGFSASDFVLIDKVAKDEGAQSLFFDEIQTVQGWESYVRSALDGGYHVMVTGSNASLLSRELGTRLTGRHITRELFPFSFNEYCRFKGLAASPEACAGYLSEGGFPQYLKFGEEVILSSLLDDILYRDISVRYGVKDVQALRELTYYLITNIGNLVSANKLTQAVHVKTAKTVLEYFSYLSQTYLCSFVPRYAYSYKAQMISPKKVYCIDNGLHSIVTTSATTDEGRKLENMVFGELRRRWSQIYYYSDEGHECDFVVCEKTQPSMVFQVCHELNHDNEEREVGGLLTAMKELQISNGAILTFNQKDIVVEGGYTIAVVPVWEWASSLAQA